MQSAECGAATHSAFCILHSAFSLPPHAQFLTARPVHSRQLLLLLLLYRPQQRVEVRLPFLLRLLAAGARLMLLRLRLRPAAALRRLLLLFLRALEDAGDLEVPLRRGVARAEIQRLDAGADRAWPGRAPPRRARDPRPRPRRCRG